MNRNRLKKEKATLELGEKFKHTQGTLFIDFKGLKVKEMEELKNNLKKINASVKVVKNTLIEKALQKIEMKEVSTLLMTGCTAFIFGQGDFSNAVKILKKTMKDYPVLKIKGGILENKILSREEIEKIAKLPSKEQLIAQLMGLLNAPLINLVNVLLAPTRKLVMVINEIKNNLENASK